MAGLFEVSQELSKPWELRVNDLHQNGQSPPSLSVHEQALNLDRVRSVIADRASRSEHFPAELFADPAWDILLELYAAQLGQRRVAVNELAKQATVPETTNIRWLKALDAAGYILRRPDPLDARRVFLLLTTKGLLAMTNYLSRAHEGSALVEAARVTCRVAGDPMLRGPTPDSLPAYRAQ